MHGLPDCERAFVDEPKLENLLRPEDKGEVFLELGFSLAKPTVLRAALLEHACTARLQKSVRIRFGLKYVLAGGMRSPDGCDPRISSVWIVEEVEGRPRFVTAYPSGGEEERS
jgi:hypothetical protein